jgi:cell wall-associated protease
MISFRKVALAALISVAVSGAYAQKKPAKNPDINTLKSKSAQLTETQLQRWSHLDLTSDTIPGMSVDRAYEFLKGKTAGKIIVGVIDSGVDIEHEDLRGAIWTNTREIAGNGIDDDNNGYVDDIHGWNFLGDATKENLEMTRILKGADDGSAEYQRAKADYDKKYREAMGQKQQVDFIWNAHQFISKRLGKESYTAEEVRALEVSDAEGTRSKMIMMQVSGQAGPDFVEEIKGFKDHVYDMLNYNLNKEFEGRKIVGDNPNDINDRKYGNNNVIGPDKDEALHGTHVAGIIAQRRANGLGGDGVAQVAEIMALRAVPNGDEYDKDIALAIRYAVDNGAKVINGSFGKSFSMQKHWVIDAIKYAASKDVLIVHAAGNDGLDLDKSENRNYPNDSEDNKTEFADNFLQIGALAPSFDENMVASFSNYGTFNVDIFAPGAQIYATVPGNKYKMEQGTSMASPNAAGVAALIRAYYPSLSAAQVKKILMESGTPISKEVVLGETQERRTFSKAAASGRIVNAYNALVMADKMAQKTKKPAKKLKG